MRKLSRILLSFCLVVSLLAMPMMEARAESVTVTGVPGSVKIGETFSVTISIPSNIGGGVYVSYDSSRLKSSSDSAGTGTINYTAFFESSPKTITFEAISEGSANIRVYMQNAEYSDAPGVISVGEFSQSVTVENAATEQPSTGGEGDTSTQKSADNSLSALKLSSGTLSPNFVYNVTNYTATVGYNVNSVVVSATPSNEKATIESVTGNGTVDLAVGTNTIQVVVKAENGVKATYTIVVTRLSEGEEEPTESESETETEDESISEDVLQWNGKQLQPTEEIPDSIKPAGFEEITMVFNNNEVPCLSFTNADLKVLHLQDEDGESALYVYDEITKTIYPFVCMTAESGFVIVLVPDEANAPAPEYYSACTLSIEGKGVINAYQFVQPASTTDTTDTTETTETTSWFGAETFYAAEPVASDFYLIYCMNNAGEKGWYVYDSVEGTFQRYLGSIHASATENETAGAAGNTEAYNQLLNELESAKKVQLMIICVAVFIVIVLVIIIVNLILRNRSDEEFDDYDDDEDDDYYDEYEFDEDEDTTSEVAQLTSEDVDDVADDDEEDDEIEIEFYEMPQEEVTVNSVEETEDDDEIEIEFYEMTETEVTVSEEIATEESVTEDDEVEVEFYNMEELLMKEAIEPEESSKKEKEEIPVKKQETPVAVENTYVDDDDDDDDLEFIELD